ncbi:MAG TPA: arginine--tRNA ligase [Baekduia sp.]|uniref:arginine--tRNA ligase n=1 Tax=Baekduia sp. TaxID=2600305 RepID=UPI002B8D1455|nr:arginine--tRNA ligase [Baekduia sp.]HMJ35157.1 arginine--tRNA ligase [Baekduia sp.]
MTHPVDDLRDAVERAAAAAAGADAPAPKGRPTLERPRQAEHGDYATNAAMLLAPVMKAAPRDVAGRLAEELRSGLGASLERVEVAGPGFLNLFLSDAWYADALGHVLAAGDRFGAGSAPVFENIDVEFVSANPTGPLHVGHARNAAYGDALARLFSFVGHDVTREFYINDYGSQVANFGRSVQARARGEEVPEDGYVGDYVTTLTLEIGDAATRPVEDVGAEAVAMMVERARASLHAFRVEFDVWFSERSLHEAGEDGTSGVEHGFAVLEAQGNSYQSDGALWLRTTEFGDDKDRVLERSSGEHTYFASDIAYAQNKRERGFDRMVYVLGADHHGYINRMRAAYQALGDDPQALDLLIMQFVHLVRAGEKVSMSKRAGEFVTLDELVEEIGVDAARWFLLNRSHDTTIEVDLELAQSESSENPVYYVQYAHARIAAVLRKAGEERVDAALAAAGAAGFGAGLSLHPSERALISKLLAWPQEAVEAADRRAVHRIATYALELAQAFTAFYRDCQVVGAEPEELESLRIALSVAAQRTIARALDLLGVSAPSEM